MQRRFELVVSELVQRFQSSEYSRMRARRVGYFERLEAREMLHADPFDPTHDHSNHDHHDSSCTCSLCASSAHAHPLFAPGTSAEYVAKFQESPEGHGHSEFRLSTRWGSTSGSGGGLGNGDGTTVSWSVVPDGTFIAGFNNEPPSNSDLVEWMRGIYGDAHNPADTTYPGETWFSHFTSSFDRWSEISGLNYVYEPADDGANLGTVSGVTNVRGDVRIGGHFIDGNSNVLAYNFFPNNGDMVLDSADNFYENLSNNSRRLRNILMHEAGHGFGLSHVISSNGAFLMEPFINTSFDGPQFDDVLGAHRGYGDFNEGANNENGNNTVANATDVGTINNGATLTIGGDADDASIASNQRDFVSIDDEGDLDYFKFTVGSASLLDVVLSPEGPTYQEGPQGGSQSPYNTKSFSDLTLQVLDDDGVTVLANIDATGLGQAESVDDVSLDGAGTYFVRIGGKTLNQVQIYSLDLSVTAANTDPEITVLESGVALTDGEAFGFGTTSVGSPITKTFTVRNDGGGTLNLGAFDALPAGFTLVNGFGSPTLTAGQSTTFDVRLNAAANGVFNGPIRFANNDGDEDPFDIFVSGVVAPPPTIIDNGDAAHTTSGSWSNSSTQGYLGDYTYSFRGNGNDKSRWTFDNLAPGEYSVAVTWPGAFNFTSDAPFTVFNGAAALGTVDVDQRVPPNDFNDAGVPWESLGNFTITGTTLAVELTDDANQVVMGDGVRIQLVTATPTPEVAVTENGVDLTDGSSTVDYGFTALNSPVTKTYTVKNEGTKLLTLGAFSAMPSGFELTAGFGDSTLEPGQTTTFDVRLKADALGSHQGTFSFANDDSDENPFEIEVKGLVASAGAEIVVLDGGVNIVDNVTTIDFGDTNEGAPISKTFTVRNDGLANLTLGAFDAAPGGFTVTAGFGSTTLATGQSTSFTVRLDATTAGAYSGTLRFASNDSDENPFDLKIEGEVDPPPFVAIIDNANQGSSTSGSWSYSTFAGYLGDYAYSFRGNGSDTASWTFTNLTPGSFDVAVTWPTVFNFTNDAPYTVFDGGNQLGTVDVNQRVAPNDFADSGVLWESLGEFNITGTTLTVVLSDDASQIVMADAVRIEQKSETPQPEIDVLDSGASLTDGVSNVDYGITPVGTPIVKTFTVENDGDALLTLGAFAAMPAGFSLAAPFGDTTLNPGQSTTFDVQFDAAVTGSFSGTISFANDDADEDPFNFTVEGLSASPDPEIVVIESGVDLTDGAANVDYGSTTIGTPVNRTFTVRNDGLATLNLGAFTSVPGGFTVSTGFGDTTLTTGQTTTFTLQMTAAVDGSFSGGVSFVNNDPDEGPFDFTVEGVVNPVPQVTIIDNNDAGFSRVGPWQYSTTSGYQGDYEYDFRGSGADRAIWTFNVAPGTYNVAATWPTIFAWTRDAPYTVLDGTTPLGTVDLDQRIAPNDFNDQGAAWENIGQFTVTGTSLVVELSDNASQTVMADAIRIEEVFNNFSGAIAPPIENVPLPLTTGLADFTIGSRAAVRGEVAWLSSNGLDDRKDSETDLGAAQQADYWRYARDVEAVFGEETERRELLDELDEQPWWKL